MPVETYIYILGVAILGVLGLTTYSSWRTRIARKRREKEKEYNLLEVRVSKNDPQRFYEMEQLYQSIAALKKKISWKQKKKGITQPKVSFEIVATKKLIRFLIWAEKGSITNGIINELKGLYKQIIIEEVPDYTAQSSRFAYAEGVTLRLDKPDILPLRKTISYENTSDKSFNDPLSSLISSISTLKDNEEVWIQHIVEPTTSIWEKRSKKIYSIVAAKTYAWLKGKERDFVEFVVDMPLWLRIVLFPISVFQFLVRGMLGSRGGEQSSEDTKTDKKPKEKKPEDFIKEKKMKPVLASNIRVFYGTYSKETYRPSFLNEITQSYATFGLPEINSVDVVPLPKNSGYVKYLFKNRKSEEKKQTFLNSEELTLFWHPPSSVIHSPFVHFIESSSQAMGDISDENTIDPFAKIKKKEETGGEEGEPVEEVPLNRRPFILPDATAIGIVDAYGKQQIFTIDDTDRRRHAYVIGQTGTGKSTLQESMILSDIHKGHGVAVIDPHGEMVERLLKFIPKSRKNDLAYFDPADTDNPPAFNILNVDKKSKDLMATELIGIFHKMFASSWGPRMEQILFNAIMGLIEAPNATIVDIPAFLTTKAYREQCLKHCSDPHVLAFWHDEFDVLDIKQQRENIVAVLNKVEKFFNNSIIRNVFSSKRNRFNFDFIMNKQKILLVNLSKGRLSPQNSELIGSMLVSRLLVDAMKRITLPEKDRKDFFLYIDEFQNFVSSVSTFESILSEARKYRLNLTIAHQYIAQLPEELTSAVFGNVGTIMSLRVGLHDAPLLVKQFGENEITEDQLTMLAPYTLFTRSIRKNMVTGVVKVKTFLPIGERFPQLDDTDVESMVAVSKKQYSWSKEDKKAYEDKLAKIQGAKDFEENLRKKKFEAKAKARKEAEENQRRAIEAKEKLAAQAAKDEEKSKKEEATPDTVSPKKEPTPEKNKA